MSTTDSLTVYRKWAPDDALWTQWAKPVLFATPPRDFAVQIKSVQIDGLTRAQSTSDAMIVVDLPGVRGIEEGLGLARLGYRPVPLYNGVSPSEFPSAAVVHVQDLVKALFVAADIVAAEALPKDAPPAFLLDANRMKGEGKQPGKFDNRWCVFPQDMPSAAFLLGHGVRRVIVRSPHLQTDLLHVLCRYQKAGISIQQSNGDVPRDCKVSEPAGFMSLFYRVGIIAGLTRNAAGGFGAAIPEAVQGGRYYGIG